MSAFVLDPRIESSSLWIMDLPLSQLRLKNDQAIPWVILIPRVAHVTELYELTQDDQQQLMREMTQTAHIMKSHFKAHKMNCGALGNIVPQLHIHVVARYPNDRFWPQSVWQPSAQKELPYEAKQAEALITALISLFKKTG